MPQPDNSLPPLETLQQRIDEAKSRVGNGKEGSGDQSNGAGQAMRAGVDLVAGVLVGGVFGYAADSWLGTLPLFFVICFFLGAAAGFRNMLREARRTGTKNK